MNIHTKIISGAHVEKVIYQTWIKVPDNKFIATCSLQGKVMFRSSKYVQLLCCTRDRSSERRPACCP